MINPEILEMARLDFKKSSSSNIIKDLTTIKKRIGLFRGALPYMALSLNNNTWFYLGTFDIEKIPDSDADKE